jgi:hypothetical protein
MPGRFLPRHERREKRRLRDKPQRPAARLTHRFPRLCAATGADAAARRRLTPEAAQCLQQVALSALRLFLADAPAGGTGLSSHETQDQPPC